MPERRKFNWNAQSGGYVFQNGILNFSQMQLNIYLYITHAHTRTMAQQKVFSKSRKTCVTLN